MAKTIDEWLETAVKRYQEVPLPDMSNLHFFRDPPRPQIIDPNYFFAPADGILLYQKVVREDGELLEVKGEQYTIKDLTHKDNFDKHLPCLVIGTFMTFYHPHLNRIPYSGRLKYEYLEPITSKNIPMLLVEKALFQGKVDLSHLQYLKNNERVLNEVYSNRLDYTYYIVQIADEDVSAIMPFEQDQNEYFAQNERFSFIRWGSQVELILPIDERYKFSLVQKTTNCVAAGLDPLVRVETRKDTDMMF